MSGLTLTHDGAQAYTGWDKVALEQWRLIKLHLGGAIVFLALRRKSSA